LHILGATARKGERSKKKQQVKKEEEGGKTKNRDVKEKRDLIPEL